MQKVQDMAAQKLKERRDKLEEIDVRMKASAERIVEDYNKAWMEIKKTSANPCKKSNVPKVNVPTNNSNTQL